MKITSELHGPKPRQCKKSKKKEQVVPAGIPPLKETISFPHRELYVVTGGITSVSLVLLQDGAFFMLERSTKMYQKVSTNLNFVEREKNVEKFWC